MKKILFSAILIIFCLFPLTTLSSCNKPCAHENCMVVKIADMTCFQDGSSLYVCNDCSATWMDVKPASHDNVVTEQEPTCMSQGGIRTRCKRCGEATFQPTCDIVDCSYIVQAIAPTCQAHGFEIESCKWCKSVRNTTTIEKTAHFYILKDGYADCYYCSSVERSDCAHAYTESDVIQPTCTSFGYTKLYCGRCELTFAKDIQSATPHDFIQASTIPATCVSVGKAEYSCYDCGLAKSEILPPKPHSAINGKCVNCNSPENTCSVTQEDSLSINSHHAFLISDSPSNSISLNIDTAYTQNLLYVFDLESGNPISFDVIYEDNAFTAYVRVQPGSSVIVAIDLPSSSPTALVKIKFLSL